MFVFASGVVFFCFRNVFFCVCFFEGVNGLCYIA